jgi:eukaryotic-like serine/threonine-protein kinase
MAQVDVDRDLLLGLLALQNNFVDRDALLDAFARWIRDRATPLGQLLCDRGALRPDDHELLCALVARHLEKFGDDPAESLRHLSSIGSVRDDLARLADADLHASLAQVSAARGDDDPYRTMAQPSLGASTSDGTRFRILRPHARGGLGQVSVALDRELDRPVALKEIQDRRADDPESRARFIQEAEITGKLEHPGIIPVYGLGHDATGRPFYAMRFIQGDSLKEAIAAFHGDEALKKDPAARLSRLRELLRRFTDVCNAVAYAHSRGVLHRDLKPGNIMLGPYGETLVVDWGLAKPVGGVSSGEDASGDASSLTDGPIRLSGLSGSAAETVAGSPIGTPAYASPEQVTGAKERLGPATDIYGLGATLYALLTGRAPVESHDLGEVIRQVQRGEIPAPRSVDPEVPRPLDAICRKAMATAPGDRYASARALAMDVTKWLDDEPVPAYREPLSARAGRWMRRHRTAVIGAVAAGLVGLIGLGAVAVVQTRSNQELKLANQKTKDALDAETKAKGETQKALAKSDEARQRAEAVLGFLRNDVLAAARPEGQDGGLGVAVTVREAIDAAEPQIAERFKDQPLIEAEVRETLGLTYWYLREAARATRQYERAAELYQTKLGPDHTETLSSRNNLAMAYADAGRIEEAIKLHEAILKQGETRLGLDHPEILASRSNLATHYAKAGRIEEAIKLLEATLKQMETMLGPDHPNTLSCRSNVASAYSAAGNVEEAIKLNEATLKQREAKLGPDHPDTLASRNNLADDYRKGGRFGEAIKLNEATLKQREAKLGPDHPDTLTSRNNLAVAYAAANRLDEAIKLDEATVKQMEAKLGPDHPDTLASRNNLALVYSVAGRLEEAIKLHEETLKQRETKLGLNHPDTLTSRNNLAEVYSVAGRLEEAIKMHERTLKQKETKLGPDHPSTLISRSNLAEAYRAAGRLDDAIRLQEATLKLRETRLGPDHPDTLFSRNNLAESYGAAGRIDEEIELHEANLKQMETKFGSDHPSTLVSLGNLAIAYASAGHSAKAESLLRERLERVRKRSGAADPRAAAAMAVLGANLIQQHKWAEAEPVFRECLAIREKIQPDDWSTFNTRSLLGSSLLGRKKYAAAEPLILAGYEGMKAREAKIPAAAKPRLQEAAHRVVQLYEAWSQPEKAAAWRRKLGLADLPADVFVTPHP